jgi:thioredoxin 1
MLSLVIKVAVGAGIGAAVGFYGKCTSGTCPLTSTWWRGAIYGAVLGLLFSMMSAGGTAMNESTKDVTHITEAQFDTEVSQSALPVVVDFYATWCGPCRSLAPVLDKAAGPLAGKVKFVKVNIDESPTLAQRFQVEGVPTLLFFRSGKAVDSIVGLPASNELEVRLKALENATGG